jgi:hypothetical protein
VANFQLSICDERRRQNDFAVDDWTCPQVKINYSRAMYKLYETTFFTVLDRHDFPDPAGGRAGRHVRLDPKKTALLTWGERQNQTHCTRIEVARRLR